MVDEVAEGEMDGTEERNEGEKGLEEEEEGV